MPSWAALATALWEATILSVSPHCPVHCTTSLWSTRGSVLSPDAAAMRHLTVPPSRVPGSCWPFPTSPNVGPGQTGPWAVPPCTGTVPQEGAGSLMGIGAPQTTQEPGGWGTPGSLLRWCRVSGSATCHPPFALGDNRFPVTLCHRAPGATSGPHGALARLEVSEGQSRGRRPPASQTFPTPVLESLSKRSWALAGCF